MAVAKAGDVFRFLIKEGEYAFGRVLLDIQAQCIDARKVDLTSPLMAFTKTILVEIFASTSKGALPPTKEVLIPGVLTSGGFLTKGFWEVVGFDEVNPEAVEFPESLSTNKSLHGILVKGELRLPLTLTFDEVKAIGIFPQTRPCIIFPEMVLFQLGRKDEITTPGLVNKELMNMKNRDLRFSEHRKKVFEAGGLEMNESYYEMSKRMGFDLKRFYTV